jgi:hypothetical protein
MVAEAAAVTRAAGPLPPDPATVGMSGIHFVRVLPASAPVQSRLSHARTWAFTYRKYAAEVEAALQAIEPPAPVDRIVGGVAAKTILAAATDELKWEELRGDKLGPWDPILADLGAPADREAWTLGLVRTAIQVAAARTNRDSETLWTNTASRLAAVAVDYRRQAAKWEAEEAKNAAVMESDRQQVTAAALFADAKQLDAIARQESHLGRELARALAAFEQVRALRPRGVDSLGFVLEHRTTAIGGRGEHAELLLGGAG